MLLDRLVRQGRAFGIHVLLGSQTLGGAYSLARSTIGQMAVRIALQCSESDAQLILSEENTAARLLTRPGEAIYNDANGLFEGNHPFQIVWLSDNERDDYLRRISDFRPADSISAARRRSCSRATCRPIRAKTRTCARIAAEMWPEICPSRPLARSAVAIKDPSHGVFADRRAATCSWPATEMKAAWGSWLPVCWGWRAAAPAAVGGQRRLAQDSMCWMARIPKRLRPAIGKVSSPICRTR